MADWANESISKSQTNRLPLKIAWHGFVWDFQTNRLVSFVELWVDVARSTNINFLAFIVFTMLYVLPFCKLYQIVDQNLLLKL